MLDYITSCTAVICTFVQNPALHSPVKSFEHFGFHKELLNGLAQFKYLQPTAIQVHTAVWTVWHLQHIQLGLIY